ncbi:hypothetical protein ACFZCU_45985 [Streptomyces canus]|uniref:hypothetical protein n=1 Tax=Streptomyces canus TaxID=58343 RepID=UPI0036EDDEC0
MTDNPTARLLDCGWCYEEQGKEVHPHPECPIGRAAVPAGLVAVPPTTALRDRIRRVLAQVDGFDFDSLEPHDYQIQAAAILAVLAAGSEDTTTTRADVLREAADAVFALDYDVMVGEEGDENLGSMREAWDLGTIHAYKLLRRMAREAQQPERTGDRTAEQTRLVSLLAAHTDSLAATIEGFIGTAANVLQPGLTRTLSFLELYKDQLLAGQLTVEMRRLLGQLADEAQQQPEYTESVIYEVVGDWGVDSADSEAGARAAVAKWLRAYPKCGAYAQQRIYRDWSDGSEWYGPWTVLPDQPAAASAGVQTDEETSR